MHLLALSWLYANRTVDALKRLEAILANTGQTLTRLGHHNYTLGPRPGLVNDREIARCLRHIREPLDLTAAAVLHCALARPRQERAPDALRSLAEHAAAERLIARGCSRTTPSSYDQRRGLKRRSGHPLIAAIFADHIQSTPPSITRALTPSCHRSAQPAVIDPRKPVSSKRAPTCRTSVEAAHPHVMVDDDGAQLLYYVAEAWRARLSARAGSRSMTASMPRGHVKFVGDPLGGEHSPRTEQAVAASSCHDGAGRPRLRPAMAYDAEVNGVGEHLPHDPGVGPSQVGGRSSGGPRPPARQARGGRLMTARSPA